jgi:hypothetical protein
MTASITPNILELLGSFFLGVVITMLTIWTLIQRVIEDEDEDDTDDDQPLEEKHA